MPQVAGACATETRMQVHCLSKARRAGLLGAPPGGGESFFSALPRALAGAMQKEGLPTEPAAVVEGLLPRLEGILGDRSRSPSPGTTSEETDLTQSTSPETAS